MLQISLSNKHHRYTPSFAEKFAKLLHTLSPDSPSQIAFISCPTLFVAFQHAKHHPGAVLLEYDQRFSAISPQQFFHYDFKEPDTIPESLKGEIELAIVDPPFLNEVWLLLISMDL